MYQVADRLDVGDFQVRWPGFRYTIVVLGRRVALISSKLLVSHKS